MGDSGRNMAKEVAEAVTAYQRQTTGHSPKAVTVVLSQDTLVITLHEALSPGWHATGLHASSCVAA